MTTELAHEADASRYTLRVDGAVFASVDYSINGDSIAFTHTYTRPDQRGKGYAADIVAFAVDDVESTSTRRIVPTCWYVGQWFDRHPERQGLLTR
jgi:hypothetical protein